MPRVIYDFPEEWNIPAGNEFLSYPAYIEYSKGHDKAIRKMLREMKRKFKLLELENELLCEKIQTLDERRK